MAKMPVKCSRSKRRLDARLPLGWAGAGCGPPPGEAGVRTTLGPLDPDLLRQGTPGCQGRMLHAAMRSRAIRKNGPLRARFARALPSQCAMRLWLKLRRFVCARHNYGRALDFHGETLRAKRLSLEPSLTSFFSLPTLVFTGGEIAIQLCAPDRAGSCSLTSERALGITCSGRSYLEDVRRTQDQV